MNKLTSFFYKRYFFSAKKDIFKSETILLIFGIIIAIATLTISTSIFDGYIYALKDTILGVNSHIYIFKNRTNEDLQQFEVDEVLEFLNHQPEVIATSPLIQVNIIAEKSGNLKGANLQGLDTSSNSLPFKYKEFVLKGNHLTSNKEIVLGAGIADYLGANIGDEIKLISPLKTTFSPMGLKQKSEKAIVVGIYNSGMNLYDDFYIFSNFELAQGLNSNDEYYSLIGVKVSNQYLYKCDYLAYVWEQQLGKDFQVRNWMDFNESLFNTLQLAKWALFAVMSIIIFVASFNVISAVSTLIIEKKEEIAILKTLGMPDNNLIYIYFGKTVILCSFAILSGLILGIILTLAVHYQPFFKLNSSVYFFEDINIRFNLFNILMILGIGHLIVLFSAFMPLLRLRKIKIINVLRNSNY